jgi:cyclic pyranopterin phosphate synthase
MSELSHLDEQGRARMVDVSGKPATAREAEAEAIVAMSEDTAAAFFGGTLPKGDAVAAVRFAAIMAAKRVPDLIPLCHPVALTALNVAVEPHAAGVRIAVVAGATGPTGVEMEAITGAAVGAVTLYDMVKGLERGVEIGPVRLLRKTGGKTGEWMR